MANTKQNKEDEFEVVMPKLWKPEEGNSIQGVLIEKQQNVGKFNSSKYTIDTGKEFVTVFGTTVLDSRMKLVSIGDCIRIKFLGTEESKKGQDTKLFELAKKFNAAEA